ncbi:prepilin-type N-terminal cleavage/methylation domain-containing protein [Enterovibrio coralii]|uniref:MSHA biogenesis protein MshC n=1 Tax=Enterovibrio coralii TaxID=294935 RepID=A0A135I3L7_9GAMM|nr:prepilin-type N-terminal cleavage/methylation domain-containing protein [Enterovibrio coralii]KXF80031.1 MSHA biogenesis protein MshC [Enterovibrio coralii]
MVLDRGFTLVELVTVLVILSVLSVYAVPRLSGAESFSVTSARDTGLSVVRQVQLRAMQQEDPSNSCFALNLTATRFGGSVASDSCKLGDDGNRSDVVDLSDAKVRASGPASIAFDLLGRPTCVGGTCKITFSQGSASASICANSEGYFYACS